MKLYVDYRVDVPMRTISKINQRVGDFRLSLDEVYIPVAIWGLEEGIGQVAKKKILEEVLKLQSEYNFTMEEVIGITYKILEYNHHVYVTDVAHDLAREYAA